MQLGKAAAARDVNSFTESADGESGWLSRDSLSEEDRARYEEQYRHIQAILSIYEHDSANYTRLFDALQQVGWVNAVKT